MNAAYRLMGNFPSRGFGDSLSSADFTSGAAIVTGTDARLPMNGVPRTRTPQKVGEVTEAYHAFEIHPLSFGQLTVMYSATGAMMQATGATRPCSYTNAATWVGEDAPAYVSGDDAMCSVLRYNDFVTLQELWVLPRDVTTLPSKPWNEDAGITLEYAFPAPVSNEMLRSLLAHYWRSASLQFFGPWDSGKKTACLYRDDLIMQHIANRDRNLTVCISDVDDCHALVPQAKGFLWQVILKNLPVQVRNITSMAAAVPLQHAHSLYRDAAVCVVYPAAEAAFNLTNGKFPALEADEDAFMQMVLTGRMGMLLEKVYSRFQAETGKTAVDECPFMADYDLALSLYRIEHAADDWALLSNWYAAQCHLSQRHEIHGRFAARLLQDVDAFVKARLEGREEEVAGLLLSQKDRYRSLMSLKLQGFLWEKAIYNEDDSTVPGKIVFACQGEGATVFFTEYPAAQAQPEDPHAANSMASLTAGILQAYCLASPLSDAQVQQLAKVTPVWRQQAALSRVMEDYVKSYEAAFPQDRIRLLQLSTQYLDADAQMKLALDMMGNTRLDSPVTEAECKAILAVRPLLKDAAASQEKLTDYYVALYCRHFADLTPVCKVASALRADTTAALCRIFTQAPGRDLQLNEQAHAFVLGAGDSLISFARDAAGVESAYREYLSHQLTASVDRGENLYGWIVAAINRSLPTRLYQDAGTREAFLFWCSRQVMDYTLNFAAGWKKLPEDDAFARLFKLAKENSPVFTDAMPKVIATYETLLQADVPGAQKQAQQLAPYLHGIPDGSLLQQSTSLYISVLLQGEFQRMGFWQVMNRKDIYAHIQRSGALPRQIFDEDTKSEAVRAIRREVMTIQQPLQYRALLNTYTSAENLFKRSVSLPAILTDNTLSVLWHDAVARCFYEQFDGFFQACQTIDNVRTLMEVADSMVGVRQKIYDSVTGRIIRLLMDVQVFIGSLPEERVLIAKVMERANMLRSTQSAKAIDLVRTECEGQLGREVFFIRRVALCLLHSVTLQGINWNNFLYQMQPEMEGMLHSPYAAGSLPLLSMIGAALRVFEVNPTADDLMFNFAQYLRTDDTMAVYTAAVRKDQKSMAVYFPSLQGSASLNAWLG